VGVALGCMLGMVSLLFMDLEKAERMKRQRELRTLYTALMENGHNVIGARHCALFLCDEGWDPAGSPIYLTSMGWKGIEPTRAELERAFRAADVDSSGFVSAAQLYSALRMNGWTAELSDVEEMIRQVDKDADSQLSFDEFAHLMRNAILQDEVRLLVRPGGSRHHVLTTGEVLNVRDVHTDPRISAESRRRYTLRGYDVRSLLLAPVRDEDGKVVGLIELVNKDANVMHGMPRVPELPRRNSEYGFSKDDEKLLRMLSAHSSIFLKHMRT